MTCIREDARSSFHWMLVVTNNFSMLDSEEDSEWNILHQMLWYYIEMNWISDCVIDLEF